MKTIHANQLSVAIAESPQPVLVDFISKSCPPCTALLPVLEELAADFDGRIDFVKADAMADDESLNTAAALGIRAVPTLILFKNGFEAARRSGILVAGKSAMNVPSDFCKMKIGFDPARNSSPCPPELRGRNSSRLG